MRTFLTPEQVKQAQQLFEQGSPKSEIALSFHLLYGVSRKTAYRHLNQDPEKYKTDWRKYRELSKQEKERPPVYYLVKWAKHNEYTSRQVADVLEMDLRFINRLWMT